MKGRRRITLTLRLVVTSPRAPFTVTGDAANRLTPGTSAPVDARVTNPNDSPLTVSGLGVVVARVAATTPGACTTADFGAISYAGPPFAVPPRATRSLSQLGISPTLWPRVVMVNRPVRQDGCRGASLALSFSGSGGVAR